MARTPGRNGAASRWVAIVAVVALGAVVGALAVMAYQRANPARTESTPAPVPTFTLGAHTATPTPTPTVSAAVPRETERFLSASGGTLWRASAGACGGEQPLIERSNDAGRSWTDVTPLYRGITQVSSLDGLAVDAVEAVGTIGAPCAPHALRSYTNGRFWEPYADVLAASRFVDPGDASLVHLGAETVDAPCSDARGLRALSNVVALVCDRVAFVRANDAWVPLPAPDAAAVAVTGVDVVVAHASDGCSGLALTRFVGADTTKAQAAGCVEGIDTSEPIAISGFDGGVAVWSGASLSNVTP